MSWYSKKEREARWKSIYGKIRFWWIMYGSREVKKIWKQTIGAYVGLYRSELLTIVKNIALGQAANEGESKAEAFARLAKELLDTNKDGMVGWDDMPQSIQDWLRDYCLWLFRSFGDTDDERAKAFEDGA